MVARRLLRRRSSRLIAGLLLCVLVGSLVFNLLLPGQARAAIAWQNSSTYTSPTGTTVTSFSITKPSGTASGTVLILQLGFDPNTNKNVTVTASGWTQVGTTIINSNWWQQAYYKVAGGSEPSSYSFSLSKAANVGAGIAAFTGVDNSSPIDDVSTLSGGNTNSSTHTAPSASASTNGDMQLNFWLYLSNITSNGFDAGLTQNWNTSTTNIGISSTRKLLNNAGATGTATATTASNTKWTSVTITLLPASRPPGISLVNTSTATCAGCSSLSPTSPSGWSDGDFFLVSVFWKNAVTLTTPDSTWIQIGSTQTDGSFNMADFYHIAVGTDPSSYSWSFSANAFAVVGMADYAGVDATNPIDDTQVAIDSSNTSTHTAPSVTSLHSNDVYAGIWGYENKDKASPTNDSSSLQMAWNDSDGNSVGSADMYETLGNAGSSGTRFTTSVQSTNPNTSQNTKAIMRAIALKPFIPLPKLLSPENGTTDVILHPVFQLKDNLLATGTEQYKIDLCGNSSCTTVLQTYDQSLSQTGWSGQDAGSGTAYVGDTTLNGSTQATYTTQTALTAGTQYWWRAYSYNVSGGYWTPPSNISTFTTSYVPAAPSLFRPVNSETKTSVLPEFNLASSDTDGDNLQYKIDLCTTSNCSTVLATYDQSGSQTGWSGQDSDTDTSYGSDTSDATVSTRAFFNLPSTLTPNTQYWWRAYAIDPAGTNTWSTASSIYTFTTNTSEVRIMSGSILNATIL